MTVGSYALQALKSQYKSQNTDLDIFSLPMTAGTQLQKSIYKYTGIANS